MLLQLSKTVKQSPKSPQIFENNGTFCADRPFSKNRSETNCQKSFVFNQLVSELQSYILSTTTETNVIVQSTGRSISFNRTSFQQQLKHWAAEFANKLWQASIVHPFNNNWNVSVNDECLVVFAASIVHPFNNNWNFITNGKRVRFSASIVHPFNNNWNFCSSLSLKRRYCFNRTSFQQQLKQ